MTFPTLPPEIVCLKDGVSLLGSPIWVSPDHISSALTCLVDKVGTILTKILKLDNPQAELHLLKSCLGIGKIDHVMHIQFRLRDPTMMVLR